MSEVQLSETLRRGDSGFDVQRVQEWLTLGGYGLIIDGEFGPATEAAVRKYESIVGAEPDGAVTPELFDLLVKPMKVALAPIEPLGRTVGALTVAYAEQHLAQRPREVGGNNRGPWVRLYMGGHDGDAWRWCAGFACFCLQRAAQTLGTPLPLTPTYSCTQLGDRARAAGLLLNGDDAVTRAAGLTPGSFFLVRGSSEEWSHTGLVRAIAKDAFTTVEGNSNENGGADAFEVCSNVRGWTDSNGTARDFIRIV